MNIQSGTDQRHRRQDRRVFGGLVLLLLGCVLFILWPRQKQEALPALSKTSPFPEDTIGLHPPSIDLQLSEAAWQQLQQKRATALQQGLLITHDDDWVPAELHVDGHSLPAKIRLKGDWLDHLQGRKWSFRVKLKSGYSWRGMTVFSLHTPAARYHLHEWLLHQVWRAADVLSPRYDFTQLSVNGQPWGIYAYEEHFVKQLPEQQQRREGPLLKWEEGGFWLGIARQLSHHGHQKHAATHSAMDPERAPVGVFESKVWLSTPDRRKILERALEQVQLLDAADPAVYPHLDFERFANYFAIADAFNAYHGITWHNQRLFYNPVTDQLEPVGFDGYGGKPTRQYGVLGQGAGAQKAALDKKLAILWQHPDFIAAYLNALRHFTSDAFWTSLDLELGDAFTKRKKWLTEEFPDYNGDIKALAEDNLYLQSLIEPFEGHSLVAQLATSPDSTVLQLQNLHHFPLEVIGWGWSAEPSAKLDQPILLAGLPARDLRGRLQRDGQITDWNALRFREQVALATQLPPPGTSLRLRERPRYVYYRLLGGAAAYVAAVQPHLASTQIQEAATSNWPPADLPDLRIEEQDIYFPPGPFQLKQPLDIPAGYTVHFPAGLQLHIGPQAFLRSYSPVMARGTAETPIQIMGTEGSGGLAVISPTAGSQFSEVIFDGLGTPQLDGWTLTGAVTVYETAATFYRCRWQNNHCEDALNAFRTDLTLTDCHFSNTPFDAFDGDFCTATVTNCQFTNIGNDGIDFSGSIATLKNIRVDGAGDKGVSVGEASDVTFLSGRINDAKIGMASKDLSTLRVRQVDLSHCPLGFAAYQKKPEYGPAVILVESHTTARVKRLREAGAGSEISVNDR